MPEPKQSGAPAGSPGVAGAGVNVKALGKSVGFSWGQIFLVTTQRKCLVAWLMAKARAEDQRKAATAASFGLDISGAILRLQCGRIKHESLRSLDSPSSERSSTIGRTLAACLGF